MFEILNKNELFINCYHIIWNQTAVHLWERKQLFITNFLHKILHNLEKGLRSKLHTWFCGIHFSNFMEKEPPSRFCCVLFSFHEVDVSDSLEVDISDVILANAKTFYYWFCLHALVIKYFEKNPSAKLYGVLNHFSQTYKIPKFGIIKLCLNVSDLIYTNEHT